MSHILLYFRRFLIFSRWGADYDHDNEDIRRSLLDFAIQKLLCGHLVRDEDMSEAQIYAVLSQRLAPDVNMPQYLLNSANPLDAMQTVHEQIAYHMHVCVAIRGGIESVRHCFIWAYYLGSGICRHVN